MPTFEVLCDGDRAAVTIDTNCLTIGWHDNNGAPRGDQEESHSSKENSLQVASDEIISVEAEKDAEGVNRFCTLHYIQKTKHIWKHESLSLAEANTDGSFQTFMEELFPLYEEGTKQRPKSLVVFINPIGGRRRAEELFRSVMVPLLDMAGISCDVIVSQRAKHLAEAAEEYDYSKVDGIVLLGGDGTFAEVINGALSKCQREAGVNVDDMGAELSPLPVPVAVVPTGTGNGVAECLVQCQDVETTTLHIIKGKRKNIDVLGNYGNRKFLGFSGCVINFGFMANLLEYCDTKLRWLRTLRYPVGIVISLLSRIPEAEVELTFKRRNTEKELKILETIQTTQNMICIWPFHFLPGETKFTYNYNADHTFNMKVFKPNGKLRLMKDFAKMAKRSNDSFDAEHILNFNAHEVTIKFPDKEGVPAASVDSNKIASIDGESVRVDNPIYTCRVYSDLVSAFSSCENIQEVYNMAKDN